MGVAAAEVERGAEVDGDRLEIGLGGSFAKLSSCLLVL